MKHLITKMKLFMVLALFLIIPVTFTDCSGGTIVNEQVCEVGSLVCEVSQSICENIPSLPPEICGYLQLACFNLELLCTNSPESQVYKTAEQSLRTVNIELKKSLESYKSDLLNE